MQEISVEDAMNVKNPIFIDVRSPKEFNEATIPSAVNIPLFSNTEREMIGTTYKEKGADQAKWLAMECVSPKIPQIMAEIRKIIQQGGRPIVFCWRGGMRSKAVATFANFSGLNAYRLTGGYRSYRQWVINSLTPDILPEKFIVLHGLTGIGKTQILYRLAALGQPVLDLEACAGHRGSAFGHLGLKGPNNQKTFDSLLHRELLRLKDCKYAFIEAESKRIGRVVQPDFLLAAKHNGIHIMLDAPLSVRAQRTYEDYVRDFVHLPNYREKVLEAFTTIQKRMSGDIADEIERKIADEEYQRVIELLFEHYYDPRYLHKTQEYNGPFLTLDASDVDHTVNELILLAEREISQVSKPVS